LACLAILAVAARAGRKADESSADERLSTPDDLPGDRVLAHFSASGEVERLTDNCEHVLGIAPELLSGRGLFDRLRVSDRVAFRCQIEEACGGRAPRPLDVNLRLPTLDGSAYQTVRLHFS